MLSIIVPFFNSASYIEPTLKSLLMQKSFDFELIFIDDGSTDDTAKIINSFFEGSPVSYTIISQNNLGVSSARNKGIIEASGEFVLFLDSDDSLESNTVQKISDFSSRGFEMMFCNYYIKKNSNRIKRIHSIMTEEDFSTSMHILGNYLNFDSKRVRFHLGSVVFRLDFLKKNELFFNTNFTSGEDSLFIIKALIYAKFVSLSKDYFYSYYKRNGSVTQSENIRLFDSFYAIKNLIDNNNTMIDRSQLSLNLLYFRAMNSFIINYYRNLIRKKRDNSIINRIRYLNNELMNNYPMIIKDFILAISLAKNEIRNFKHYLNFFFIMLFKILLKIR
jgi:glycosyltransferase involved in cell wall biosynthesis